MYFPIDTLREYFAAKPETPFIDWDWYLALVKDDEQEDLKRFLSKLGVKSVVSVDTVSLGSYDSAPIPSVCFDHDYFYRELANRWHDRSYYYQNFNVPHLDGLPEILQAIKSQQSQEQSLVLWRTLLNLLSDLRSKGKTLAEIMTGHVERKQRGPGYKYRWTTFESPDMLSLRQEPWLMDKNGQFLAPDKMTADSLPSLYDEEHACYKALIDFLQFKRVEPPADPNRFLTKEQKALLKLAEVAKKAGVTDNAELLRLIEEGRKADERKKNRERNKTASGIQRQDTGAEMEESDTNEADEEQTVSPVVRRTRREIIHRTSSIPTYPREPKACQDIGDWDEYSRPSVNYAKKLKREKDRSVREIDRIAYLQELQDKALGMEKYSFGWFKALLEMEELSAEENSLNSREVSIRFGRVALEPGTVRILVLSQPSCGIPRFMEDLSNITLVLHMDSGQKQLGVEVASIRGYSLRVKLKSGAELGDVDLSSVKEASIDARNPSFLLKE